MSCCETQCVIEPQMGKLPVRFGDKTLRYGLIAFYSLGAIYVVSMLAIRLF